MQALIDADILLYEIGFAAQQKTEEGLILKSVEEVNEMVDERIKEICAAVYATAPPKLFITGKGNFRHAVAKSREYKGNRKQIKPHYYSYIKAYLQAQWGAVVVDGMEADDALCIEQTRSLLERNTIICSRDKDLKQCPGFHYTWECGRQGSWGPAWVEDIGSLVLRGPKKLTGTGSLFFYSQLLTGDSTDTYDGLQGCGPIRAFNILDGASSEREMYERVLAAYKAKYGEEAEERLYEQAQLAWMIREVDDEGNPVFWTRPEQGVGGVSGDALEKGEGQ